MLKGRRLGGRKFRRQHSVGPYVLDFYCPAEGSPLNSMGLFTTIPRAGSTTWNGRRLWKLWAFAFSGSRTEPC